MPLDLTTALTVNDPVKLTLSPPPPSDNTQPQAAQNQPKRPNSDSYGSAQSQCSACTFSWFLPCFLD